MIYKTSYRIEEVVAEVGYLFIIPVVDDTLMFNRIGAISKKENSRDTSQMALVVEMEDAAIGVRSMAEIDALNSPKGVKASTLITNN